MKSAFSSFLADDSGAITVDWVLVSAACVGMSLTLIVLLGTA